MNPVEMWARRFCEVVEIDSVKRTYTGEGPPSWRGGRTEIEANLDFNNLEHWWHLVQLVDFRQIMKDAQRLLDLGCGPGWPVIPLAQYVPALVAVDRSELAISLLQRNLNAQCISNVTPLQADAASLPFAPSTFGSAVMVDLLDVVPDPDGVAREAYRVLIPGGTFCSYVQNFRAILGDCPERCSRSVSKSAEALRYEVHFTSLNPPHSLDVIFAADGYHPVARVVPLSRGMVETRIDSVLAELEQLRPAILPKVKVYRTREFVLETAADPFAAAGFVDLQVRPVNPEMCHAFAASLADQKTLPETTDAFEAQAAAILDAMASADESGSSGLSVKGRRPNPLPQAGGRNP